MTDYTIVTISNRTPKESYYCLNEWHKSVKGTNHIVLESMGSQFKGLGDKPRFVYRAIKQGLIKTKYIIFCDCWDFVFASSPEEIIDTYRIFDSDLVISAEKNCFPSDLKEEYDKLPYISSYRYLNSGMIVGLTDSLMTTLEVMDAENIPDDYWDAERNCNFHYNDQKLYQDIFLQQPVKMVLDHKQILSQTLHDVQLDELDIRNPLGIMNLETGKFPLTFHFNGNSKTENGTKAAILERLGL